MFLDGFEFISLYFHAFWGHFLEIFKNTYKNASFLWDTFYLRVKNFFREEAAYTPIISM